MAVHHTTQRILALNPLGDLNLLSALSEVKVMQPSGKLQVSQVAEW